MRKVGMTLAAALALAAFGAAPAAMAGEVPPSSGPCAVVGYAVQKSGIEIDMHIPVFEDNYHYVCSQTG